MWNKMSVRTLTLPEGKWSVIEIFALFPVKHKAVISLLAACLVFVFHLQDGNCPHVVVLSGISTWLMARSWDGTPLSPPPYGLTWLQRECGKILVKMWYVAAALALLDVFFFTSGGYDPSSWRVSLQWGRNTLKNEHSVRKWLFNVWKRHSSTSTYVMLC